MKNNISGTKGKTFREFFRSLITAWAAFAVDWLAVELLVYIFGGEVGRFKFISYPLALATTYFLSKYWVFRGTAAKSGAQVKELTLYILGAIVALGISWASIYFLSDRGAMLHFRISNAIGMAAVFVWNFFYRKYVVFRAKKPEGVEDDGQTVALNGESRV